MHKRDPKIMLPKMSAQQREKFARAVAEEAEARPDNIAAARGIARCLKAERKQIVELVAQLRAAREKAGVSLSELAERTGIQKSALSRLENSLAPNPTTVTLQRYAQAIGVAIEYQIKAAGK